MRNPIMLDENITLDFYKDEIRFIKTMYPLYIAVLFIGFVFFIALVVLFIIHKEKGLIWLMLLYILGCVTAFIRKEVIIDTSHKKVTVNYFLWKYLIRHKDIKYNDKLFFITYYVEPDEYDQYRSLNTPTQNSSEQVTRLLPSSHYFFELGRKKIISFRKEDSVNKFLTLSKKYITVSKRTGKSIFKSGD